MNKLPKDRKKTQWVRIGKIALTLTITISVGFTFGWYSTENYITHEGKACAHVDTTDTAPPTEPAEPDTGWRNELRALRLQLAQPAPPGSTVMIYRPAAVRDTIPIPIQVPFYDTLQVIPPQETPPPRPWHTEGRP